MLRRLTITLKHDRADPCSQRDWNLLLHTITMFYLSVTLGEGGNNINSKRQISASYTVEAKGRLSVLIS